MRVWRMHFSPGVILYTIYSAEQTYLLCHAGRFF
jgi:hypothetical protein